ncbi:ABC transporter ATP-binding protein [Vagococcus xieshaowenii]|uniref:Putative hemin import ATP-binding protein HrtA n=1 Tax=Vagococcus xieshaowenii TaxID=2562451 RepID=A0AAJ5JLS5_9ENTE|nr:ABC transporter ATP-binding protein [Vagococcus xieshaowenii]QCA29127.1 ABC transporter ATP-binding protein [Vagococcus xieshaowenii]TFZ40896.1 ABC transporter ATP-binding protein [Vagococcus xieshaowenii]
MSKSLELINVSKIYQEDNQEKVVALDNVSISVQPGELVALVGPSGSGKSTFLSIAGALLQPTSGDVKIAGQSLTSLSAKQLSTLRLDKIGFILQSSNLVPYLTVLDQLLVVNRMKGKKAKEAQGLATELLTELGLDNQFHKLPHELSGGQKQRVAIGRALMNDPELILADEPTASLDSKKAYEVVELLRKETKNRNKAAIMVTHDERMLAFCDRVYYMNDGQLLTKLAH